MFLYTNNTFSEKVIKKLILLIIAKKTKYLGINLSREVKDFYSENYKTLMKEVEEDISK